MKIEEVRGSLLTTAKENLEKFKCENLAFAEKKKSEVEKLIQ